MIFHVLTIFPEFFEGPFAHGVIKRGKDAGLLQIRIHNLRDWTHSDIILAFRFMPAAGSYTEFYLMPQGGGPRPKSDCARALPLAVKFSF